MRRINLNLAYALRAILICPTLTGAGREIGLSQPAMSLALAKLRAHFGDEIVLYQNGAKRLTALGKALNLRVEHLLHATDGVFALRLGFDPASETRTVVLAAPEPIEIVFLSGVVQAILREGPALGARLLTFDQGTSAALFDRGADVVVVPESMIDPAYSHMPLFDQNLSCLVCETSPLAGRSIGEEEYRLGRHVALSLALERAASAEGSIGPAGAQLMRERTIVVRTDHFSTLPNVIAGTDLIATSSDWLAQYLASIHPLRTATPPFSGLTKIYAQWEPWRADEPYIAWLLAHLRDASRWLNESAISANDRGI